MSRSIVLSNGELCVALDEHAQVRDIYYPYVGLEDHVRGHYVHRVGVWAEGKMSWFGEDPEWQIVVGAQTDALASAVVATHGSMRVELHFTDMVCTDRSVFIRRVSIKNTAEHAREIKLFFGHQFEIYKSHGSDTAYFDPESGGVIHYKGHRVFLIGATIDGAPMSDYATGRANFQGKEGTHKDAEDGQLSRNPIEHGPADSVIGLYASYAKGQSRTAYYWLAAAQSIADAQHMNAEVVSTTPESLLKTATSFWHAWINAYQWDFGSLAPEQVTLFKRSLMYMRAHADNNGGIIASIDSDMLQYGMDTYSYVWPRDGAYIALALDHAGDSSLARKFFEFCRSVITEDGYFLHKYLPDTSLGSSWHPWIQNGVPQLPIQEDETALVVYAIRAHYAMHKDLEFLEEMYKPVVEKAANFMVRYRDPATGMPLPSYDLWERKRGCSTFTACSVYGALIAASEISKILGNDANEGTYRKAAIEIQKGILKYLWNDADGVFHNMMLPNGAGHSIDGTVDISSAYGVFSFGVLPADDPRLIRAFDTSVRVLSHGVESGGLARFENDDYYRIDASAPGNPWVITTLWYAEYLLARAKSEHDLDRVREIFAWVVKHAQPSGVLSEQLHPKSGQQVGATPLTWAHGAYVLTVLKYLEVSKRLR